MSPPHPLTKLSHHPTRRIAAAELEHFRLAHLVEVAGDAVFEATGSYGELQGFLRRHLIEQARHEAAAEGVARADAIGDLNRVAAAEIEFLAGQQAARPVIDAGRF